MDIRVKEGGMMMVENFSVVKRKSTIIIPPSLTQGRVWLFRFSIVIIVSGLSFVSIEVGLDKTL